MLKFKSSPFEEDVEKATNENNLTEDWSLIMHICDKAVNYDDGAKFCLKAILKRMHHNVPRVVMQALTLLDACIKNCNRNFLLQVASSEFTNEISRLLPKMHPAASTKLKELIQKWAHEEFKSDPELCIIPALYYKLKSEGVEFPSMEVKEKVKPLCTNPNAVTSEEEEKDLIKAIELSLKDTGRYDLLSNNESHQTNVYNSDTIINPFPVRALYDFEAAEDNELTIKAGELLLVIDNSDSNWWKGRNFRGEGLIPANFVSCTAEDSQEIDQEISEDTLDTLEILDKDIQLDEEKIERALNLLSDADPTGEIPDPPDMLRLEYECSKMTPLIEQNLQDIDNRLAAMNFVNEKIMDAFELFYSLSNQFPIMNTLVRNAQYKISNLPAINQVPISSLNNSRHENTCASPAVSSSTLPSIDSQSIISENLTQSQPINSLPKPLIQQMPQVIPHNLSHLTMPSYENSSNEFVHNTIRVSKPLESQIIQPSVLYATHPEAFQNVPQPISIPITYAPYLQNQGLLQNSGPYSNYMPFPYPLTSMGACFPLQYYIKSDLIAPHNIPTTETTISAENQVTQQNASTSTLETEAEPSSTTESSINYLNDLQELNCNAYLPTTQIDKENSSVNSNFSTVADSNLSSETNTTLPK